MRRILVVVVVLWAAAACGDATPRELGPTDPATLAATLADLAALGDKRVGTPAGAATATYLEGRLRAAGLGDVHRESFRVPRHDVRSASLSLVVDGVGGREPAFDVLEASGPGQVSAAVVRCGSATPAELEGLDLDGKVALVQRSVTFHRSSQYRNVAAHGARAMLYISDAPGNLRQVGSVRRSFEALGPIPALTLGAEDGAALLAAATLTATIAVDAVATPADGHNIVGRVAGTMAEQIVVGAHYDSWFTGANDNGAGVAALVALAQRRASRPKPRRTLVFVAYDGEETGLYGGYDFMHRHRGVEPIAALLGFEVPAPRDATLLAFGRSNHPALDEALKTAGLRGLYPIYVNMDAVPAIFGGIIPTDLQGLYRDGVPAATTATSYAYYHTREDTPDRVDTAFLAEVVDSFDQAIQLLDALPEGALAARDPALWNASALASERDGRLSIAIRVTDAAGAPQVDAPVEATFLVDDFFLSGSAAGRTGADGKVTLELADETGRPNRFVHVTAGPSYPLVETVLRLVR